MAENGFSVVTEDVEDVAPIKARYQVPLELRACHTAIVDGYIIEGHVPVREINRLLTERPAILGLAVPGMPNGAPGMTVEGFAPEPFDVIAFDQAGNTEVYASYSP
jgi:hypothetical protein